MSESPLRHEVTRESFNLVDGFVAVRDEPGLGVTINPKTLETYRVA